MPFDNSNFQPEPNDAVLRVLTGGRAKIEHEGHWCQNGPGDGHVTFCASVAIRHAAGYGRMDEGAAARDLWGRAFDALQDQIRLPQSLPDFNDSVATTHADVLNLFDRAIAARRAHLAQTAPVEAA